MFLITLTQQQVYLYLATTVFLGGNYILFRRRFFKGGFDFNTSHFYLGLIFSLMTSFAFFNMTIKSESEEQFYFEEDLDELIEMVIPRTIREKKVVSPPIEKAQPKKIKDIVLIDITESPIEKVEPFLDPVEKPLDSPSTKQLIEERPPIVAPIEKDESEGFISIAEQMPRFPGCEDMEGSQKEKEACAQQKMLQYIYKNLKYPKIAIDNKVEGMAVLRFIVDKEGKIGEVKILRNPGAGCGQAGLKVIEGMNDLPVRWTPGKQRGRPVNVMYTLPIKFKLKS